MEHERDRSEIDVERSPGAGRSPRPESESELHGLLRRVPGRARSFARCPRTGGPSLAQRLVQDAGADAPALGQHLWRRVQGHRQGQRQGQRLVHSRSSQNPQAALLSGFLLFSAGSIS